ncbi:MAG: recombinase family protein [Chloroflexi bacterium]|nr:recombinase family protein [Chloroflexota bacterium]
MPPFAYLRKSVSRDPSREVSHDLQEAAVRELAARHGDADALVLLSDWDKSGRLGADKRPAYRALLDAIESGECTAVYSYSLSRLGRSVPELARLIAECDRRDVAVRIAVDAVDTTSASGRLLTHVLASVAAFEADVASERVRAANAAKLARGESLATVPRYGDRVGEDSSVVLAAFTETGSYSGAARTLNERGIKPRNSKRGVWWPSSVATVVKRLDSTVTSHRPSRGYKAGGSDFALARLLRCPTCGTLLTGTRDRVGAEGGGRVRYSCRLGSVTPHARTSVSEHLILKAVKLEAARLRTPSEIEQSFGDDAARAELGARRTRILDLYEAGHIDRADFSTRIAAVDRELAAVDARRVVVAVPRIDWSWDPKRLNSVLRALFEQITLDPVTFQPVRFEWTVPEWRSQMGQL